MVVVLGLLLCSLYYLYLCMYVCNVELQYIFIYIAGQWNWH